MYEKPQFSNRFPVRVFRIEVSITSSSPKSPLVEESSQIRPLHSPHWFQLIDTIKIIVKTYILY